MKKQIQALAIALIATAISSYGATGIFGSYVEIWDGTTSTIYKGENFSSVPNFQGAAFGTFNSLSGTLLIGNAQIDTFKNGGGDVTGGNLQYRVYKTGGSIGSFSTQTFSFQNNATFTDLGGMSITGSGDQGWGNTGDINILTLASAGNGNYTVEIFFQATTNEGARFSNNGGSNFKATFDVVPEPATWALLAFSLMTVIIFRRRRA